MPDDHATEVHSLPILRAYERQEVERYLAAVEEEAALLEQRLEAAQLRRAGAESAIIAASVEAAVEPVMQAGMSELEREEREHEATLTAIRSRALFDARRILVDSEREVLALRAALQGVLDELDAGHGGDGAPPMLSVAPEPALDHPSRGITALHPASGAGRRPWLQSVDGPSLAG